MRRMQPVYQLEASGEVGAPTVQPAAGVHWEARGTAQAELRLLPSCDRKGR